MLNSILAFVARFTVGKHIVGALAYVHEKLDGKRTEINLILLALVHALKLAGVIAPAAAATIEQSLLTLVPVLLADRARKVISTVDKVVPQ